jgi:ABC-2 type transport system permease protein
VTTVIQSVVIFVVGWLAGARFPGGLVGIAVTIVAAILLAAALASFSNALALLLRSQESVIGVAQLLVLPLVFLSSAVMDTRVAPEWIQTVAKYNPVDWAASTSRIALSADPDWSDVLWRLGGLLAVAIVVGWLATRAFRTYQRAA